MILKSEINYIYKNVSTNFAKQHTHKEKNDKLRNKDRITFFFYRRKN